MALPCSCHGDQEGTSLNRLSVWDGRFLPPLRGLELPGFARLPRLNAGFFDGKIEVENAKGDPEDEKGEGVKPEGDGQKIENDVGRQE